MSEPENEETSNQGRFDQEIQLINSKVYYCSRCAYNFETKALFDNHVLEHMDENIGNRDNYMKYIGMACSSCGKTFEVASDLMLHYSTVCFVPPFTCIHCKRHCFESQYLVMHLIFSHNYTEEMLREGGYLMDGHHNPFEITRSFMRNFQNIKNIKVLTENTETSYNTDNSTFNMVSESCTKIQKTLRKRQNLSSTTLEKNYTCDICNKSFSRKCVLDLHIQKHFLNFEENQDSMDNTENSIAIGNYDNSSFDVNKRQNFSSTDTSVVISTDASDYQRATIKPSNISLGSGIWEEVQSKRKFRNVKSSVSRKRKIRKKKFMAKSGFALQKSSSPRKFLKSSDDYFNFSTLKENKLKLPLKDTKNLTSKRIKLVKKMKKAHDYKVSEHQSSSSRVMLKSAIENVDISLFKDIKLKSSLDEARSIVSKRMKQSKNRSIDIMDVVQLHSKQKTTKKARNKTKSKFSKAVQCKKMSKTSQIGVFVCHLCNKRFKDGYKLRRHSLIHTGERPFTCSKCKKTFTRDDHMKRHFKRVCSKIKDSE